MLKMGRQLSALSPAAGPRRRCPACITSTLTQRRPGSICRAGPYIYHLRPPHKALAIFATTSLPSSRFRYVIYARGLLAWGMRSVIVDSFLASYAS